MRVDSGVGSNNALEKVLTRWPDDSGIGRPTAARHVLVVTDDDSDMDAGTFDAMFTSSRSAAWIRRPTEPA